MLDDEQAFDRAVKYLARAVFLLYCRWAPREGLRCLQAAEALFAHRCVGTRFERSWTALMTDMACELSGEFELLRTGIMARERERGRDGADDSETSRQLMVSVPIARLLDDRPHEALAYALKRWRPGKTFTLLDFGVTIRVSSSLLYAGDAEAAHAYLCDRWWTLRRSGLFSTQVYDNAAYHRARNAVALYWEETHDRRTRREVLHYTARFAHHPPVMRGMYALLRASLARADGNSARCRRLLTQARDACMARGGDAGAWCARYRLAQLDGSAAALAEAAAWFSARGVQHPERWVAQSVPGAPGFE